MFKRILFIFCFLPLGLFAQKLSSSSVKQAQKAYDKAISFIYTNQLDFAINELNRASSLDTNFLAAFQQLGDIYRKTGNYGQAIISYNKILKIDPNFYPLTYFNLAESELNTGDYTNNTF